MFLHRRPRYLLLVAAGLVLAGCKDTKIVSYTVPKESPSAPPPAVAMPAEASSVPAMHWQTPAGWQEQPANGMRQGSFLVTGTNGASADMSVITFPGDVGGDFANLNRWRAQVHLPPITPAELPQAFAHVNGPAGEFLMVDLLGESAGSVGGEKRMLGAILKQPERTWFFKMEGTPSLVEAQKATFIDFLKSVQFSTGPAAAPAGAPVRAASTNDLPPDARGVPAPGALAADTLPPDHPPLNGAVNQTGGSMTSTPVAVATGDALTWTAPADWKVTPGSAMRKGSYAVSGPDGVGDLSITAFPGDVGGDLANVNRWRDQLGLPPVAELNGAVQFFDTNGLHMLVFDGANSGRAILGAIVPQPGQTWFFKLTGPAALVAHNKPAFLAFLRTVKAP